MSIDAGASGRLRRRLRRGLYSFLGPIVVKYAPPLARARLISGKTLLSLLPVNFWAYLWRMMTKEFYEQFDADFREYNRRVMYGGAIGKRLLEMESGYNRVEVFDQDRGGVVTAIDDLCRAGGANFHTVCEIGTARGFFLDYLSKRLPAIRRFIGFDLNREIIAENEEAFKDRSDLEFVHRELADWIEERGGPGMIFVAVRCLPFFTPNELGELLGLIRERIRPGAIVIYEGVDLDLDAQLESKPRRFTEFSHNHPYQLRKAGYHIFRQQVLPPDRTVEDPREYGMILVAATTTPLGGGI